MKRILIVATGLGSLIVATQAHAATRISCPLANANRTISNALPSGWSTVPFAERLTGTRITESGVLQTLICEYGAAGQIQRAAPADHRCTSDPGGFNCLPTVLTESKATPVPLPMPTGAVVHRSGTITFRAVRGSPAALDLDTGNTTGGPGAEISGLFFEKRGWGHDLASAAKIWPHRGAALGKAGCAASEDQFTHGSYTLFLPDVGQHICMKTSENRFAEYTVVERGAAAGGVQTVTVRYTTWR